MSGSASNPIMSRRANGPVRTVRGLLLFLVVTLAFLAGCAGPINSSTSGSPEITLQPASQTVPAGQPATFTVSAAGNSPLTYQWRKNGSNIAGATSSTYTTPPTTIADSGSTFQVMVSNSSQSDLSALATLTVDGLPSIATQPANQTVNVGHTATFTVVATGAPPLSYQWQKNQVNIPGATSASYTTPATTSADNGTSFRVIVTNPVTSVTSNAATLTVYTGPSITTQPANQMANVGQTATFTVVATGAPPLSYQWQKNQVNIAGATSASYSTPAATSADNGTTFRVIVTNPVTSVTSNAATLTVNSGPSITTQPANQTVNAGQTATFTVVATGAPPLSYQWQKNQVNIPGATSASYTTPATTSADNGTAFRVIVTNPVTSVTSNAATLTVNSGPSITTQPANQTVNVGQTATFTVVAIGAPPLSYQWQKNQVNIAGATSASYTTPATTSADNGTSFRVIVTNPVTSVTSNAATLTVNTGPSITTQPANQTVNVGQTATFTVVAIGAPPLSYQWQKNQVNIAGATSASYTTPATTSADNGTTFRVIVTNPVTSVTSNAATLTVNSGPSITTQPANQTVNVGQTATFTVVATGAPPLSYQWQKNQVNIPGAISASYTTPATTSADNGTSFRVIVTNPVTSVTSNGATLTVNSGPSITTQPANQTVNVGQTATFTVVAIGAPPLSYQWQKNQVNIAGATSASYTTPATTSADSGTLFQVIVTNPVGNVTSNPATLTVTVAASVSVLTQHNDNARTGQNTSETILNTSNVNVNRFGKLFAMPSDGQVYAQPLYVPGVTINGGVHNLVILATENDSVYAYDADSSGAPLWKASMVDAEHGAGAGETPFVIAATNLCDDLHPLVGITSTPVIDPTSKTIYVEAKSTNGASYFHRLHALDLLTGNEKTPGPVVIAGTVNGTGDGSSNGQLVFDDFQHMNRPGLLLLNGTIYIAYASHCDRSPFHGWLFAYDAATFTQKSVYVTTPNGGLGGFWLSGAGVAADANGNIFIASGNGDFDTTNVPARETGDTLLKLGTTNQILTQLDYFTPGDQAFLQENDDDLGSGGVLLLPEQPGPFPHILVAAGKEGRIYVVNRDQMTTNNSHYCSGCSNDSEIIEESSSPAVGSMFNIAAYWNNTLYFWGVKDVLKSIPTTNGLPDFTHITGSTPLINFPGVGVSVSSNGTTAGSAIVWAIDSSEYGAPGPGPGPAVLYAYDATNILTMLYSSAQNTTRDAAGNAVKFAVPTVANGKVYVGTSTEVDVYGPLPQ